MRRTFGIGLAVAVLALAAGCGKKAETTPTGPATTGVEGGWTLIGREIAGKKETEADLAQRPMEERKIRATGDQMIGTSGGKQDPMSYKLNPSATPPEIDLTKTAPDGKSSLTMYGIYKLEGNILTICAIPSTNPADRPKEFKTAPDSPTIIMTLKKD